MGASFDYDIIPDKKHEMTNAQIKAACEVIFEKTAYDYGHAGYTGTLAEKTDEGVTICRDKMFASQEEAERFVDNELDSDKWGPADVVPIEDVGWFVGGWCSA